MCVCVHVQKCVCVSVRMCVFLCLFLFDTKSLQVCECRLFDLRRRSCIKESRGGDFVKSQLLVRGTY